METIIIKKQKSLAASVPDTPAAPSPAEPVLTLSQLRSVFEAAQSPEACGVQLSIADDVRADLQRGADLVQSIVRRGEVVYGINTGFGNLANKKIDEADTRLLQSSLVRSHAAGVGEPLEPALVRLIMLLKIQSLCRGYSGVRPALVAALTALFNSGLVPVIPAKGSVGASGDLAPLAHLSLVLMGEGELLEGGKRVPAAPALKAAGLAPLDLAPKEGLALLNGTQVSTALALKGLFLGAELFKAALGCGALSVEAYSGSRTPFDGRIHAARGQQGQIDSAAFFRALLGKTSEIGASHVNCDRIQDPYCLRCMPQVFCAALTQLRNSARVLEIEANAASDNPLVFPDEGEILSGGNFHAEPVAMAADNLALAFAELGSISERRISMLIDAHLSRLPPFLVENAGVNSGFMIAHVTAASLASQNKALSFPCCVDSIPTSANQEDHVSMAPNAARRLGEMAWNLRHILAIEYLAAVQGIDFKSPLHTSERLEKYRSALRKVVPFYDKDRTFAPDIEKAAALISGGVFAYACELELT